MNLALYQRLLAGEQMTHLLATPALWRLSGPDRIRYLNGQVTADVTALPQGEAQLAAVCTAKGRMEGAVNIAAQPDALFLDAEPELRESLGARLDKYLIADDAAFEDISELWSLSHIFGATPPPAPAEGFVVRHDRYGLPGHDVWLPGTGAVVRGETVDRSIVETLRLEQGIPRWGAELTPQTLPPEAGPFMLRAISYTKGCYVGQETIARLKSVGHVNRTLALLHSATPQFPAPGTKLATREKEIGLVTSSGLSPRLGVGVSLGYVPLALSTPGTLLQAGELALVVSPFPEVP